MDKIVRKKELMKDKNHTNHFQTDLLEQQQPWMDNSNAIWLASTLSLSRNFDKFKFASKLPTERRKQIISFVQDTLLEKNGDLKKPTLIQSENIAPLEKEFLFEHFLTSQSFQQVHSGEAFIIDQTGEFLTMVNIRDHLNIQITDCRGEIENSWQRIAKIEMEIGKQMQYAFSTKFGFLTADPSQCGTGLIVSTFVQPSALIHSDKVDEFLDSVLDETISISGLYGDPNEIIGDLIAVKNNCTLGITEEQVLSSVRLFTTKLLVEEKNIRNQLRKTGDPEIKDKVSRAFGVLTHSYQIEAVEALNAIGLLKLGLDLNWVSDISMADLNALFFKCRRAHLLIECGKKITQEELLHKRASYIHRILKNTKLNI